MEEHWRRACIESPRRYDATVHSTVIYGSKRKKSARILSNMYCNRTCEAYLVVLCHLESLAMLRDIRQLHPQVLVLTHSTVLKAT